MDEHFGFTPPKHIQSIPAVSIVIPMYNTEKYIGACLTSILAQTFQNFEVIVVNNCSTDNSAAVVESFVPKFGGRLKLTSTKKNSGSAGPPNNKGINYTTGKYVFSVDSDDLIVKEALGRLYDIAETYRADVVHMDRHLVFSVGADEPFPKPENIFAQYPQDKTVNKLTVETNDISERMKKFCNEDFYGVAGWRNFVRRDLLIENEITFPTLPSSQDVIWTAELLLYAKKILRIPDTLYIHRVRPGSITQTQRSAEEHVAFWLDVGIRSLAVFDKFLSEQKFFQDNPQLRWQLLDYFENTTLRAAMPRWSPNEPPYKFYEAFKKRLVDERGGDFDGGIDGHEALLAYLCTSSNFFRLNCMMMSQYIKKLEQQLNALQSGK